MNSSWVVIGISGVTNGGKSTLTKSLSKYFAAKSTCISQDDYYYPIDSSFHVPAPGIPGHSNWDVITSIDMEKMKKDIKFTLSNPPNIQNGPPILLLEGFLLFEDNYINCVCDKKYFFTLDYAQCFERRKQRQYEPPDVPGYFEKCAWPMYESYYKHVSKYVHGVKYIDGCSNLDDIFNNVCKEIEECCQKF